MINKVHVVFYKHLTSWLLYGHLEDLYNEFFIQKINNTNETTSNDKKEKEPDKGFDVETIEKKFFNDMWNYDVNDKILPTYIGQTLAKKILTTGQTIIMLSNDPRQKKDTKLMTKNVENLIWGEKEFEYFEKLKTLQNESNLSILEFERTVDELRSFVTKHLWHVIVDEAHLVDRLRIIKDFYLLGRGDMFQEFIRLATHILDKTPTSHTSRDINLAFQMALRKTQSSDETALDCFNFSVPVSLIGKDDGTSDSKEQSVFGAGTEFSEKEREDPIGNVLLIYFYFIFFQFKIFFSLINCRQKRMGSDCF